MQTFPTGKLLLIDTLGGTIWYGRRGSGPCSNAVTCGPWRVCVRVCVYLRGACIYLRGDCVYLRGACVYLRGACVYLRGACVYLRVPEVHLVLLQHLPADYASVVDDDVEVRPRPELALPVSDGGERRDDEEGAPDAHAVDLLQEGDGLDGLPQAHLICQDAVPSDRDRTGVRGQEGWAVTMETRQQ